MENLSNDVGVYSTATTRGSGTIFPLRYQSGGNNFFGWVRLENAGKTAGTGTTVITYGFSDQPNLGVLAGTTLEDGAAAVPEPATALPLLLLGAAGVALNRKRKNRA